MRPTAARRLLGTALAVLAAAGCAAPADIIPDPLPGPVMAPPAGPDLPLPAYARPAGEPAASITLDDPGAPP